LLSIVGIPWGIRRIVDWYFAEEAVIMDRQDWRGALGESRRLVKGDWWRTFGTTFVMGFLSAVAAPFLAGVLMLLTDIPLWFLNLMCSVAYVMIVPFVAIALTFLYWDLKARDEDVSSAARAG
jgi:ABC-type sugar transport system permease subunit